MELVAEILSVVGALLLSVSCGVLLEELLLGGLVRLILAHQSAAGTTIKDNQPMKGEERPCLHSETC